MAAQQATLTLLGRSGRTYAIDVHAPDAAATQLTFNPSGGAAATSPNTLRVPEDCVIMDFAIAASPTATGVVLYNNSGAILGGALRHANQLVTLANRQKLNVPLRAGDILSGLQHA
jgi:hypothetical protein